VSQGLWYPIPGAGLPRSDSNLPGAERAYRDGVSQGFDLVDGDVAVPVTYGAAVLAAAHGQVVRADTAYAEMDPRAWQLLLSDVAAGADEEQLDQLRGRQVWIRTPDGTTLRYGHLSGIAPGLVVGRSVSRGQVIGFVGNSGTDDGVAGSRDRARLRFEVWLADDEDGFLGAGLDTDEVRHAAASLFVGP
jgi:murein DD-endopeptidase MepM/ murein hydrolase activator NlpD